MTNDTTSLPARAAASLSACLLVSASAGFGCLYAWTAGQHHGPVLAGLAVAMALGLELAKPLAVAGIFKSLRAFRLAQAAGMTLLAGAAILYSLTAELSLVAQIRGDAAAERAASSTAAQRNASEYRRAEQVLRNIGTARPAAEIGAEITAIDGLPGILINGKPCGGPANGYTTRQHCPRRATLLAELARAEARQRQEGKLSALAAVPIPAAGKAADPGAAALSVYLGALGLPVPTDLLAQWLALVAVLALEIGSATAVLLVRAVVGPNQPSASAPAAVRPSASEPVRADTFADTQTPILSGPDRDEDKVSDKPRKRRLGRAQVASKADAERAIVDKLRQEGGRMEADGVRGLAAVIGGRKTTVHAALTGLMATGLLAKVGGELVLRA